MNIVLIILLIVLAVILGIVAFIYSWIRNVKRQFRAGGLDINLNSLKELSSINEYEMEHTPKSLSGMTSVLLPKISEDFPDFNWAEIKDMLEDEIKERLKDSGAEDIYIHRSVISEYNKYKNNISITTQTGLKYKKDVISQSGHRMYIQSRYTAEIIYMQDLSDKGESDKLDMLNCPNCGAPIKHNKSKICEYCNTGFTELNVRAWSIESLKEI